MCETGYIDFLTLSVLAIFGEMFYFSTLSVDIRPLHGAMALRCLPRDRGPIEDDGEVR